jgi:hypothetical protein
MWRAGNREQGQLLWLRPLTPASSALHPCLLPSLLGPTEDFAGNDQLARAGRLADEFTNLLGDGLPRSFRRSCFQVLQTAELMLKGALQVGFQAFVGLRHIRSQLARMRGDVLRADVPGYVFGNGFTTQVNGAGLYWLNRWARGWTLPRRLGGPDFRWADRTLRRKLPRGRGALRLRRPTRLGLFTLGTAEKLFYFRSQGIGLIGRRPGSPRLTGWRPGRLGRTRPCYFFLLYILAGAQQLPEAIEYKDDDPHQNLPEIGGGHQRDVTRKVHG